MRDDNPICAIATPPGRGGIGVVRISGGKLEPFISGLIGHDVSPRHASFTAFLDADGVAIDYGIALYFQGPHSFTGESVLELQGHGGPAVMQALLGRCQQLGARLAEPGEFTRRAFLNGKIDLAQAESVADMIDAASIEAARSALRSLSGEFSQRVQAMQAKLTELRMRVEAALDFPEEEDVVEAEQRIVRSGIETIQLELQSVLQSARQGQLLRDGVHVALIGQPNVGKSSLMNALAGEDIAIVTEIAGTTRDALRQEIQIRGVSFHVIDTAGLRETSDQVEQMGIARTWAAVERAGIALLLVDSQHGLGANEQAIIDKLPAGITRITVHNKIDLSGGVPKTSGDSEIWLSAKTGEGLESLRDILLRSAGWQPAGEGGFMARQRHLDALSQTRQRLDSAAGLLNQLELLAEELRLAQESLSEITGEFLPDDLLGRIFSQFCIGK